jgi:hypothetical protein
MRPYKRAGRLVSSDKLLNELVFVFGFKFLPVCFKGACRKQRASSCFGGKCRSKLFVLVVEPLLLFRPVRPMVSGNNQLVFGILVL